MPNAEVDVDSKLRRWAQIIWPGFMAACLLEALVFSMIDPGEVHWPSAFAQPSRQAVYSAAFFCFWMITTACGWTVLWFQDGDTQLTRKSPPRL